MSQKDTTPVTTEENTLVGKLMRRKKDRERAAAASHIHDDIARRAYERFRDRGCEPGREMEDWLLAERDVSGGDSDDAA